MIRSLAARFLREEDAQDLIEYVLLAAVVSLGAIAAMSYLSTQINASYSNTGSQVSSS